MTKKEMMDTINKKTQEIWEVKWSKEYTERRYRFFMKHYNKYVMTEYYKDVLRAEKRKKETGEIPFFI